MNRTKAIVVCCLVAFVSAAAQTNVPISLPADPSAAVITLDWHGYWQDRSRKNPNPALTIRADGSIIVTDPADVVPDLQGKLSSAELQELFRFLIQVRDFFAIDGGDILNAIRAEEARTGQRVGVSDAGEPVIRVKTADKEKEVRFYGLGFYAGRYPISLFPSMKALDNLNAIEAKLTRLSEEVKGGGKAGIAAGLAAANAYLAREKPDLPLFTADDYLRTLLSPQGRLMQFVQPARDGSSNSVSVQYRPNREPEFRFSVYGPRPALAGPATPRD